MDRLSAARARVSLREACGFLEIVGVVVNMNVWTRIKLAEGAMPGPA